MRKPDVCICERLREIVSVPVLLSAYDLWTNSLAGKRDLKMDDDPNAHLPLSSGERRQMILALTLIVVCAVGFFVFGMVRDDTEETSETWSSFSEADAGDPSDSAMDEDSRNFEPISVAPGVQQSLMSASANIPFILEIPLGERSFYVKLVDPLTDEIRLTIFLEAGSRFTVFVDPGEYRVRCVTGFVWSGDLFFGDDSQFFERQELLSFEAVAGSTVGRSLAFLPSDQANPGQRVLAKDAF